MIRNSNLLQIKNLSVGYDKSNPILQNIAFTLEKGLIGIIGKNGVGKSTFLKTISGLTKPISGNIYINNKNIFELPIEERAKLISIVLTEKNLDPYFSVFELVLSGRSPHTGFYGLPSNKDILIAERYLNKCGIEHLRNKKINEISDGEKQKCMIARALTQETAIILLDEPTSFLDFSARYQVMELLSKIAEEEEKIILFSSHDLEIVFKATQKCLVFISKTEFELLESKILKGSQIIEKLLNGTNIIIDIEKKFNNL